MTTHTLHRGFFLVVVLVFGAIFMTLFAGLTNFLVSQHKLITHDYSSEQANAIAEAGLNYYKWYLAKFSGDVTHGTGLPGPYEIPYVDPESTTTGMFSLAVASSSYCGQVESVSIESTGWTLADPGVTRTVYGRYAQPTVAEYAYIINASVWAGSDRVIIGPYHSNNGVRMDGTNNSTVTSQLEEWNCTSSFGCSPDQTVAGVFGDGPNYDLWSSPSTPVSFSAVTSDLDDIKNHAQNDGGIYLGPSGDYGYRIALQSDGTVDVYVVDRTYNYWGYTSEYGWQTERNVIDDDDFLATYILNEHCPVLYVEDKVWLEGEVNQKVTVAAAYVGNTSITPSIILNNDILYTSSTSGLLAIAEEDVLVGLVVPDDMELNGIFFAKDGRFGRNYYTTSGFRDVLTQHDSYVKRNSLTLNGTVVSSGRVGTKWTSGGTFVSGFNTRYNSYDRALVNNPPPLSPRTSEDYKFIEWREVK